MSSTSPAVHEGVAELTNRVRLLEERMSEVERRLGTAAAESPGREDTNAETASVGMPSLMDDPAGILTVAGTGLLGLAAAYLLRALTENGTLPASVGVGAGLIYAMSWLVWAARTPAGETFRTGLRTITSILILIPLLWEATVRFGALNSWTTSGLLALFGIFGLAISWKKDLTMVAWLTSIAVLLACAGLMSRTNDPVPYTAGLLALAAAVEASACLEHYLGERWVVALMTDLAVLFLTYVATRPPGSLAAYAPIAPGVAILILMLLPTIYLAGMIIRTLGRARAISVFEVAQCVAAFLIAAWGCIQVSHGHPSAIASVGVFCAVVSAACYGVAFAFLERHPSKHRNFHVYAAFGLVLVLGAAFLLLKGGALPAALATLAVAFALAGLNSGRVTMKLHSAIYLILAVSSSGLAAAANARLLSTDGHASGTASLAMWFTAAAAALTYSTILKARPPIAGSTAYSYVAGAVGTTTFWSFAGLISVLVNPLCRGLAAHREVVDFCPTVLTVVLAAGCLLAAYGARRLAGRELTWISVGLAILTGGKILLQDLHEATAFGVVVSLVSYGAALSMLPRLLRWTHAAPTDAGQQPREA